jgi:hypothetical protein
MKTACMIATVIALHSSLTFSQEEGFPPVDRKVEPLTLRTRIPLPGVYGRIDHFGWDSKRGLLIVSALGNDTVEIIRDWKRRNTIAGLEHTQAAVYIPSVDRIAVSSQSGKLRFYDAASYVLVRTLDFGNEANTDNSATIQIRSGSMSATALARAAHAVVDTATMERIEEYKVGTHPESFQLETTGPRIFVNLPGQGSIGVIDRTTGEVTKWKIPGHTNVHAMALDESSQRLFTASLQTGGLHLKSRTQDGLYMSWPNMLPQGGSEVLLFYVGD